MKFYRIRQITGPEPVVWCERHARELLDRGVRLREVAGPCSLCAALAAAGQTDPQVREGAGLPPTPRRTGVDGAPAPARVSPGTQAYLDSLDAIDGAARERG